MKYFQILYNNSIAIVAPCVASEQEKVATLLHLIQERDITDPYALDLMSKLASMLPRCDISTKGFNIEDLPIETLEAIFYGNTKEPSLIAQIHALTPHKAKPSDKLPLKLTPNQTANLLAQLIAVSRDTGCDATGLMDRYSLDDIDCLIRDYQEMCRPYDERVEEELQERWDRDHAHKLVDPAFLFGLGLK